MAKKSAIEKQKHRSDLVQRCAEKRKRLKAMAKDESLPPEERFKARLKLNEMPKNGSPVRLRNRCAVSGRSRGYYRKFGLSRIALRDLASRGAVPGVLKSSW